MKIALYISGHGFGHLAQIAPVLVRLHQARPDYRVLIRTSLPEAEVRARLPFAFDFEAGAVDTGVVQKSAIEEDRDASIALLRDWVATMPAQIEREEALMRRFAPDLIVSDISPLAFPVARAIGVPGIGLATLDWHTIYSHWLENSDPVIAALNEAYGCCDLLLRPPMSMQMPVFPKQRAIGLIAASPHRADDPLLHDSRRKALVLFGGCGNPAFDLEALSDMPEWLFLIPDVVDAPGNVLSISFDTDNRAVDLMPFVDLVVCKPGYGVLAECWRSQTPMAWVERPEFPEYPMLKTWLDQQLPSAGMTRAVFSSGQWLPTLEAALNCSRSFPALAQDGAIEAADLLIEIVEGEDGVKL